MPTKSPLMEPAAAQVAKRQRKHVRASDSGPNRNSARTKFNVYRDNLPLISSATAKRLAPHVAQLTGVNASVIVDRLKSGFLHTFPKGITVSVVGNSRGEGVLDWLTKKVGSTRLFTSKEKTPEGMPVDTKIKESFPTDTKTLYQMNNNVYANRQQDVGDWKWVAGTKFIHYYMKANNVIVAVRGTADLRDLMADIKITFQNVQGSNRFKEDLVSIRKFQEQYPPNQYNYYFTGHSLGGALIDEYLKLGLGISAISFNPAVQKEHYNLAGHHRIYNTQDPLYDLMGKHVPSAEVREYKGPQQSTFDKIISYVPIIGDAQKALKGHSLDNYVGGRMLRSMMPSVMDRPHLRGPDMIGGSFGNWLMKNVVAPVANVAVPAITLGSLTTNDIKKGKFVPDPSKIAPYLVQSGSNLLAAKTGDPTGAIGQVVRTARTGEYADEGSGRRCRWEDKGTRYPDWQEVCDGGGYYYNNSKHGRVYCANCD